ncbi:MAG: hypothetical protein ACM3NG_00060 [Candidatus Doudnabacteria bacterium]
MLKVAVAKLMPLLGFTSVYSTDYPLQGINIRPGETKKLEASEPIPADFHGISTTGTYEFTIEVIIEGARMAKIKQRVTVI